MSPQRPGQFLQNLRASGLVGEATLGKAEQSASAGDDRALAQELVAKGILTPFQARRILAGRTQGFFIGPYTITDKIGAGGMGQVYKAVHRQMARTVALKVLPKARRADPQAQARFMREVRANAQLMHPNIVTAYDVGQQEDITYLALEYVEGTSLDQRIKTRGRLDPAEAARIGEQVALALEHAREHGIVHRDIKPANILIDHQGCAKVLDMGLARIERPGADVDESTTLTRDGVVMGTLDYLAPEQALDSHRADTRADIYSLGCTLYHMLTGRVPFPAHTATEKLMKHQMRQPQDVRELAPDVPPGLAGIVAKMMAKRPSERYPTPGQVALALRSPDACAAASPLVEASDRGVHVDVQGAPVSTRPLVDSSAWPDLGDGDAMPRAPVPPPRPRNDGERGTYVPRGHHGTDAPGGGLGSRVSLDPWALAWPIRLLYGIAAGVLGPFARLLKPVLWVVVLALIAYIPYYIARTSSPGTRTDNFVLNGDSLVAILCRSAVLESPLWQTYFAHRATLPHVRRPFLQFDLKGGGGSYSLTTRDGATQEELYTCRQQASVRNKANVVDPLVSNTAVAVIKKHAEKDPGLVSALVRALRRADKSSIGRFTWALGEIGPGAREALPVLGDLANSAGDATTQNAARSAIERIRPPPDHSAGPPEP